MIRLIIAMIIVTIIGVPIVSLMIDKMGILLGFLCYCLTLVIGAAFEKYA